MGRTGNRPGMQTIQAKKLCVLGLFAVKKLEQLATGTL